MGAKKGTIPPNAGKGRPPGVKNKLSKSVKDAFKAAFDELQEKPGMKLADWAVANPTEFYKLAAKLIPAEISGVDGGPIEVVDPSRPKITREEWLEQHGLGCKMLLDTNE